MLSYAFLNAAHMSDFKDYTTVYNNKKKKKKKIYLNTHIVMNHESEVRSMLIVNELGCEVRLEVALEAAREEHFNGSRN